MTWRSPRSLQRSAPIPPPVQQAYRYLFARVALDPGILELVGQELRPSGKRLVCREPNN
jgi:hypothetical protein